MWRYVIRSTIRRFQEALAKELGHKGRRVIIIMRKAIIRFVYNGSEKVTEY